MNIAIFDLKAWEKDLFKKGLKGNKVFYFEKPVQEVNLKKLKNIEALTSFITSKIDRKVLEALPNLKLIASRSTGFDHIDVEAAQQRNIAIANVPSYGENTVAEHTFGLILALTRNIHKAWLRTKKNDFTIEGLKGFDLHGKTIGVVGAGKIGSHVIRIARGFGMNVLAYDPYPNELMAETLEYTYVSLNTLLKSSDIISLHVPLIPATKHIINKKNLSKIKKGALLINTARGGLVETTALIKGLESGILRGVGLDVLEEEELLLEEKHMLRRGGRNEKALRSIVRNHALLNKDNVVFTPHIAFYSQEAVERITKTTIENIIAFIKGKKENIVSVK